MTTTSPMIHSTAIVDDGATIGEGSRIWHFSHIMAGARIGRNVTLGQNVFVASRVSVGDGSKIQNNVSLYDGVILHENVFLGPSCVFTNVRHPRSAVSRKNEFEATIVGEGATVGANATIVCGVTIGPFAFVGAGAVVTCDIPAHGLFFGVPATQKGWVCSCGETLKLNPNGECRRCCQRYSLTPSGNLQKDN